MLFRSQGRKTSHKMSVDKPMRRAETPSTPSAGNSVLAYDEPMHKEMREPSRANKGKKFNGFARFVVSPALTWGAYRNACAPT